MNRVMLLVGAVCAVGCGGDGTPQGPGEQPPQRGTIQGSALDETNTGVPGVAVQISRTGASPRNTTTNAAGSYTFTAVDIGAWSLSATPPAGFTADGVLTANVQVTANATSTVPPLLLRRTQPPPPPPPPGEATVVTMTDDVFTPNSVTISTGGRVRWVNNGSNIHNTTASGGAWSSPNMSSGQTFEHTFNQAGTFGYSCTLHAGMTGTITVQ
jgi:plastocyanin